jgi:hypothetical protein
VKALIAVVEARRYSRICGAMSLDSDTNSSGAASASAAPTAFSFAGFL